MVAHYSADRGENCSLAGGLRRKKFLFFFHTKRLLIDSSGVKVVFNATDIHTRPQGYKKLAGYETTFLETNISLKQKKKNNNKLKQAQRQCLVVSDASSSNKATMRDDDDDDNAGDVII